MNRDNGFGKFVIKANFRKLMELIRVQAASKTLPLVQPLHSSIYLITLERGLA
jgi:hypothetical protein